MKRVFITAIAFAMLVACNNESKTDSGEKAAEPVADRAASWHPVRRPGADKPVHRLVQARRYGSNYPPESHRFNRSHPAHHRLRGHLFQET